jgi:isoquinoline 1-oxidoreductase subunit alpha
VALTGGLPLPTYNLNINGQSHSVTVANGDMPLLWVLRDHLGMTGTKYGCGIEVCGACTVLINGQPEKSCNMNVKEAAGRKIMTVEGLAADPQGQKAQAAWVQHQVPQCGFCQSGMLMSTVGAMKAGHHGSEIAPELGNVCVCGTYPRIKTATKTL